MRGITGIVLGAVAAALLGVAGCGPRVIHEKTHDVEAGEVRGPVLEKLKKDVKLSVEVSSPDVPVAVYVVLEKDEKAAQEAIIGDRTPSGLLTSEINTKGKTVEITMPEDGGLAILIHNPLSNRKKVSVKVKASRL